MNNILFIDGEEYGVSFDSVELQELLENVVIMSRLMGLRVDYIESSNLSKTMRVNHSNGKCSYIDFYYDSLGGERSIYKISVNEKIDYHLYFVKNRIVNDIEEEVVKDKIKNLIENL